MIMMGIGRGTHADRYSDMHINVGRKIAKGRRTHLVSQSEIICIETRRRKQKTDTHKPLDRQRDIYVQTIRLTVHH